MVVEFKEDFAHEVHGNLVPGAGVKELKVIVYDYQQAVDRVVVLALDYHPYDLEEVVLVKGVRKRSSLLLCHHLQVLIQQVQHYLHLVPVVDVSLVANQWKHRGQQMLVFKQFDTGSNQSQVIFSDILLFELAHDYRNNLAVSLDILPLIGLFS
jgi:hypothetical protein